MAVQSKRRAAGSGLSSGSALRNCWARPVAVPSSFGAGDEALGASLRDGVGVDMETEERVFGPAFDLLAHVDAADFFDAADGPARLPAHQLLKVHLEFFLGGVVFAAWIGLATEVGIARRTEAWTEGMKWKSPTRGALYARRARLAKMRAFSGRVGLRSHCPANSRSRKYASRPARVGSWPRCFSRIVSVPSSSTSSGLWSRCAAARASLPGWPPPSAPRCHLTDALRLRLEGRRRLNSHRTLLSKPGSYSGRASADCFGSYWVGRVIDIASD